MYNAPDRVYTANCVRMVSMNHYSQQGIVHMLDGAMKPATKTVAQLLQSEAHFESFRNCEWFLKSTLKSFRQRSLHIAKVFNSWQVNSAGFDYLNH